MFYAVLEQPWKGTPTTMVCIKQNGGRSMEFSQYVVDALAPINHISKDYDYSFLSLIRDSIKNAPNKKDAHILSVIAGAVAMRYNSHEQAFEPMASIGVQNFDTVDLDILYSTLQLTKSSYLRAKFAHIIWLHFKDNRYGELAVSEYIEAFQREYNIDEWVNSYTQIRSAYHIAIALGTKSESFKRIRVVMNQTLTQLCDNDPVDLPLKMLRLIAKDAPREDLPIYETLVYSMSNRSFDPANRDTALADLTFSVWEILCRRTKKDIHPFKRKYACYYEAQAKIIAQNNDYFRAASMLKKACLLFKDIDTEKLLELRNLLEIWQKETVKRMHTETFEIDTRPYWNTIEPLFEELTQQEAIIQFGRCTKVYHTSNVKRELHEKQQQALFLSIVSSNVLNESGQSVQKLPSLRDAINSGDTEAVKKHMVYHVAERRRFGDAIPTQIAHQLLLRKGTITENNLDFLVHNNALVPDNRKKIICQGICMGLNGDLYAAMHILLPQTENIIRNLVRLCGDSVTFLDDDGSEKYKPLSSLLKSKILKECYDEDWIFTFQSILDEVGGENLRNLNAHGLLEPECANSAASLYFIGLLILFLSQYGEQSYPILVSLAKRGQPHHTNSSDDDTERNIE